MARVFEVGTLARKSGRKGGMGSQGDSRIHGGREAAETRNPVFPYKHTHTYPSVPSSLVRLRPWPWSERLLVPMDRKE